MKKKYEAPLMEVYCFEVEDVLMSTCTGECVNCPGYGDCQNDGGCILDGICITDTETCLSDGYCFTDGASCTDY